MYSISGSSEFPPSLFSKRIIGSKIAAENFGNKELLSLEIAAVSDFFFSSVEAESSCPRRGSIFFCWKDGKMKLPQRTGEWR